MRILYLIDSLAVGGAESLLIDLTSHFHENCREIQVEIATLYHLGTFGRKLEAKGETRIFSFDGQHKYDPRIVARLLYLVNDREYDIIHAHLFPSSYVAACTSILATEPRWIFTEHNVWNRRRKYRILRPLDRCVYSRFTQIVTVSEKVKSALLDWQPQLEPKVETIPNGVVIPKQVRRRPRMIGRPLRFIVVSRLEPAKGIDLLLDALRPLRDYDFQVKVAGDGSQRILLEQLTKQYGLTNRIEFLGMRHDIQELMQQSDCLLVPSRWEGLPIAILEAMANGLPVIASRVGGIPEVIQDDVNGMLVPAEDVQSLRSQLEEIIRNPGRLATMGDSARETAIKNYSIEVTAQRHHTIYDRSMK